MDRRVRRVAERRPEDARPPFEGGEYEELFLIADVRVDWGMPVAEDEIAFFLTPEGPIVSFPFPEPGRWRLVDTTGLVEATDQEGIVARFRDLITRHVSPGTSITDPTWTSSFHIHRRVVDTFRAGGPSSPATPRTCTARPAGRG